MTPLNMLSMAFTAYYWITETWDAAAPRIPWWMWMVPCGAQLLVPFFEVLR